MTDKEMKKLIQDGLKTVHDNVNTMLEDELLDLDYDDDTIDAIVNGVQEKIRTLFDLETNLAHAKDQLKLKQMIETLKTKA